MQAIGLARFDPFTAGEPPEKDLSAGQRARRPGTGRETSLLGYLRKEMGQYV